MICGSRVGLTDNAYWLANFQKLPNQESFKGKIVHSSELDNVDLKNKHVLVVGGGASGIEALELAVHLGAKVS